MNGRTAMRALRRLLSGEPDGAFVFAPARRGGFPAAAGPADFYVHVPYCRKKCAFCPYNTKPLDEAEVPAFYGALRAEARLWAGQTAAAAPENRLPHGRKNPYWSARRAHRQKASARWTQNSL